MRYHYPPLGTDNGVEIDCGLIRQENQGQGGMGEMLEGCTQRCGKMLAKQHVAWFPEQTQDAGADGWNQQDAKRDGGPEPGGGQTDPADQQQGRQRKRDHAAAQVVEELPARQGRKRIALMTDLAACRVARTRHPRQQPGSYLPVAAYPAMATADVGTVAGWILLVQLDIAEQTGACVTTFQQIMAEYAVFRHAVF